MQEVELRLAVPPAARAGVSQDLLRGKVTTEVLRARYFDTAERCLASAGISLRVREEGTRRVQTVKVGGADAMRRVEHEVELEPGAEPVVDVRRHLDSPAAQPLHDALARSADGALMLQFTTDVKRTRRIVTSRGARIEVAFDEGRIRAAGRSLPVCELELELKRGPASALAGLASDWITRRGLWLSMSSKAERGSWLARGDDRVAPVTARTPELEESAQALRFLAAVLTSCLHQILGNAAHVAAGRESDEVVHQLRVGLRRLRTALRELAGFGADFPETWEATLRAAFSELGEFRDVELIVPTYAAQIAAAGAPDLPPLQTSTRARRPRTTVRDPGFQRVLLEVLACSLQPPPAAIDESGQPPLAKPMLVSHLHALHRRVVRDGRRFAALDADRQHRVRKRLKRLRYLSEFAAPLFSQRRVERFLAAWKDAQDALGDYNDLHIASAAYRAHAAKHPAAWFAVGWLEAGKKRGVKRCARALKAAGKATPFWER